MDRLNTWDYIVVDVETTGFAADGADRIVEVAVLRCRPNAGIVDRFVTLVDPQRSMGATRVHGIDAATNRGAPTFRAIAPALRRRLENGVIVAHNSRFDLAFLNAELGRAGLAPPDAPTLCTMGLTARLGIDTRGRSLSACCQYFAISRGRAHGAEDDARATANLLLYLLRQANAQGMDTLTDLGCAPAPQPRSQASVSVGPACTGPPRPGRVSARLATAAGHLGDQSPIRDVDLAAYLDLLDRVLLDRVLTTSEVDALRAMARRCDLTDEDIAHAHREYLARLIEVAWEDSVLTADERGDIEWTGCLLGLGTAEIEQAVDGGRTTWRP
jgi:DNA polymerase III epsilon subunit-like protein